MIAVSESAPTEPGGYLPSSSDLARQETAKLIGRLENSFVPSNVGHGTIELPLTVSEWSLSKTLTLRT